MLSQVVEALEETRTQLLLVSEPIFASAADLLARFQTLPPAAAQARENTKLSELETKAGLLQVSGLFLQMFCWDMGSGDIVPKLRPHPADMLLHELQPVTGLGQVAAHLPGTPAHAQCSSRQRARGALLRSLLIKKSLCRWRMDCTFCIQRPIRCIVLCARTQYSSHPWVPGNWEASLWHARPSLHPTQPELYQSATGTPPWSASCAGSRCVFAGVHQQSVRVA